MKELKSKNFRNSIRPAPPQLITHRFRSPSPGMSTAVAGKRRSRFCSVSMNTLISAPVEDCFNLVSRQIEEVTEWDPTISDAKPICCEDIGVGSKSRITFCLAGSVEEVTVVIRSLVPNRVFMWTSEHSTQLQEEWRFRTGLSGTIITLTISYNPYGGGLLKYLTRRVRMRSHIEGVILEILGRLRTTAEMPEHRSHF